MTKHSSVLIPRVMTPSELDVLLTEVVEGQLVSAGTAGTAEHFYLNSMFHTSPSVLMVTPGLSTYINEYNYYRVVSTQTNNTYYNMEAFPVQIILMYTNLDPGTSFGTYKVFQGNPLTYTLELGAKTGSTDTRTFRRRVNVAEITGTIAPEYDDSYRAVISADPTDFVWLGHAVVAKGINVLTATNGVIYTKRITRMVRFFGRAELNSFRLEERKMKAQAFDRQQALNQETRIKELGYQSELDRLKALNLKSNM